MERLKVDRQIIKMTGRPALQDMRQCIRETEIKPKPWYATPIISTDPQSSMRDKGWNA